MVSTLDVLVEVLFAEGEAQVGCRTVVIMFYVWAWWVICLPRAPFLTARTHEFSPVLMMLTRLIVFALYRKTMTLFGWVEDPVILWFVWCLLCRMQGMQVVGRLGTGRLVCVNIYDMNTV